MDHVEVDCPVKFQSTYREGSLPPIVVPMKLGCGYEVDPRFRHTEIDALQVDTGRPWIASNGIQDPFDRLSERDGPDLMLACRREKSTEADFGFGTPIRLTREC
jgi:hypothetical protein